MSRAITTEVVKVERFHEASVETMKCGRCQESFPAIGFPDYCPACGTEFSGTADLSEPLETVNTRMKDTRC